MLYYHDSIKKGLPRPSFPSQIILIWKHEVVGETFFGLLCPQISADGFFWFANFGCFFYHLSHLVSLFCQNYFLQNCGRSAYLKEKSKPQTQKVAKGHAAEKGLSWSSPSLPTVVFTQSFLSQLPNLCDNYHKRTANRSSRRLCFPLSQVIWTQRDSCPHMILTESAVPEKVTPVSKRLSVCPLRAGKLISIRMSCLRNVFISQWLLKKWGPWVGRV